MSKISEEVINSLSINLREIINKTKIFKAINSKFK